MAATLICPAKIIEEILLRLPVKSLYRFKCVSKQWKTIISSNRFIKSHLNFSNSLQIEKLILLSDDQFHYSVDWVDLQNPRISQVKATKLPLPPFNRWSAGLIGSCNGLALSTLQDDDYIKTLRIINPTSGEFIVVNPIKVEHDYKFEEMEVLGLGYDSMTDDYKIIMISAWNHFASVFSLRSNRLSDIKLPNDYTMSMFLNYRFKNVVCLNDCLHWLYYKHEENLSLWSIAAFSLRNEKFVDMELPSIFNKGRNGVWFRDKLYVLGGCFCLTLFGDDNLTELWVMKTYGVKESWKKISIYVLSTYNVEPFWLLGDGEIVLLVDMDELVFYNLEENTMRKVKITGVPSIYKVAGIWVDSLVSPKCLNLSE